MLGGLTNLRNYLAVSAVVAIVIYIVQILAGAMMANAMQNLNQAARSAGMAQALADAITEPIRAVIAPNNPIGAIAGGLLWPLLGLWIILALAVFFFAILGRGFNQAASTIR